MHNIDDAHDMMNDQEQMAVEDFREMEGDELLSIWEHTQSMEMDIRSRFGDNVILSPNYEKIIIHELHNRLLNNTLDLSMPKALRKKSYKPRAKRRCPHPLTRP